MMSTQSDLNFLFHRARDYGHPEAQALVKAWDHLTDLDPESAITMAEDADLKEQIEGLEKELDDLDTRNQFLDNQKAALETAIEALRWSAFGGCKKLSCEFSDDYDFYQEEQAKEAIREWAPDLMDDTQAAFLLVKDGEMAEVWTSPSFSSQVAFSRVY